MFSKSDPKKMFQEARNLLDNENFDEAIRAFKRIIELSPTSYEAYTNMGLAYAQKFFSIADSIGQEKIRGVASEYFSESIRNYDKAIALLKIFIEKYESEKELLAEVFLFRAESNYYLENMEGAFSDYSNAIKYNSNNPDIYIRRGLLYLDELDDPELAIEDFSKAIKIRPSAKVYISRCWAYMDNGDAEEAVKDYKRAKAIDITTAKNSERKTSLFKYNQWEQFKKEADNLIF